jgi:hypothetical protein
MAYWTPKAERFLSRLELKQLRDFAEAKCLLDLEYGREVYRTMRPASTPTNFDNKKQPVKKS